MTTVINHLSASKPHPIRDAASELAPAPSLEVLARTRLLTVLTGLGFLHAILAIAYRIDPARWQLDSPLSALKPEPWSATPALCAAFATAIFLLTLRLLLPRLPLRWTHPLGALVVVLTAVNGLGAFTLGNTPEKTAVLMLVVAGAGFLLFSTRWLWLALTITLGGWSWFAWRADFGPGWTFFGIVLTGAALLALLFQRLELRSLREMLRSAPTFEYTIGPALEPASETLEMKTGENAEKFRRWYEATFEGIAIHEKGIIIEANQPLAALLGCEMKELPGKDLLHWFTRASRDLIEESILLGNYRPFEAVALHADKTELYLELYTKQIPYQGRTVMVTALRDITERKRAAAALATEQTRLEQQCRRQAALADIEPGVGHPGDAGNILLRITRAVAEVLPATGGACALACEDGQWGLATEHLPDAAKAAGFDPVVQLARVAQWITENKESFVVSKIASDDPFNVNEPVNYLSAYVGLPLLDGKKVTGVLFALETGARHFQPEDLDFLNTLASRAGAAIVKARLYAELSEANQRLQAQSADLRVKNQELAAVKESADASSRAKSEFLATMSHELRTPLNGILGLSNLLLQSELDSEQQDAAEGVHTSAENLLGTISRILDFSKLESRQHALQATVIDVRQMIHGAVATGRRRMAGKNIHFHTMLGTELPARVRGDDAALQQILTHLVDNAVKFTDKGEVAVGAVKHGENGQHLTLRFTVSDTGIGISPEAQSRLFQSFTQVDASHSRRFGGVGLGLAISKQLIDLMGGEIGVESTPGQGSAFWFTLPFEKAA